MVIKMKRDGYSFPTGNDSSFAAAARISPPMLKPENELKPEELIAYCEDQMAYYLIPRYVDFRDSLPKTGTQRIQKYKLVDEGVTATMWDREKAGYKLKRERK